MSKKKIRFHNVVDGFGSGVQSGLNYVFSMASGVHRLKQRGVEDRRDYSTTAMHSVMGAIVGLFSSLPVALTMLPPDVSAPLLFSTMIGCMAAGFTGAGQLTSLYYAGKHDEKMESLEEEKKKRLAPPKPEQRLA